MGAVVDEILYPIAVVGLRVWLAAMRDESGGHLTGLNLRFDFNDGTSLTRGVWLPKDMALQMTTLNETTGVGDWVWEGTNSGGSATGFEHFDLRDGKLFFDYRRCNWAPNCTFEGVAPFDHDGAMLKIVDGELVGDLSKLKLGTGTTPISGNWHAMETDEVEEFEKRYLPPSGVPFISKCAR